MLSRLCWRFSNILPRDYSLVPPFGWPHDLIFPRSDAACTLRRLPFPLGARDAFIDPPRSCNVVCHALRQRTLKLRSAVFTTSANHQPQGSYRAPLDSLLHQQLGLYRIAIAAIPLRSLLLLTRVPELIWKCVNQELSCYTIQRRNILFRYDAECAKEQ